MTAAGLERLSIHQWVRTDIPTDEFLRACAANGVGSVALLRRCVVPFGIEPTVELMAELGLRASSYSALGYWTTNHTPEGLPFGLPQMLREMDNAVRLGAPTMVVVSGGL